MKCYGGGGGAGGIAEVLIGGGGGGAGGGVLAMEDTWPSDLQASGDAQRLVPCHPARHFLWQPRSGSTHPPPNRRPPTHPSSLFSLTRKLYFLLFYIFQHGQFPLIVT